MNHDVLSRFRIQETSLPKHRSCRHGRQMQATEVKRQAHCDAVLVDEHLQCDVIMSCFMSPCNIGTDFSSIFYYQRVLMSTDMKQYEYFLRGCPSAISRAVIPSVHRSLLLSYVASGFSSHAMTSGAIQYGVPINVFLLPMVLSSCALTPKSTVTNQIIQSDQKQ